MAVKKILPFVVCFFCLPALASQWKTEIGNYLEKRDYQGAVGYLAGQFENIEKADKADVCVLLAYMYSRLENRIEEIRWIVEYFESYEGKDSGFLFLGLSAQAALTEYTASWKSQYPLLTDMAFISSDADSFFYPKGILPIGLEITTEAYYKLSTPESVIKGGLFKAGFNLLTLEIDDLLQKSKTHTFFLEVKAGDLVITKEISIDAEVSSPMGPRQTVRGMTPREYILFLYVDGELVLTSKKTQTDVPLKMNIPPANLPYGFKPDYYVTRNNPGQNFFGISDAIGLLTYLAKELFKKKGPKKSEEPRIQKLQEIGVAVKQKDVEGTEREVRTHLRLKTKSAGYTWLKSQ
ncbi:MAG: hypothetical protein WCC06_05470 [Candidatus Aminicenantales bacterium]